MKTLREVVLEAGKINKNKRSYPQSVLESIKNQMGSQVKERGLIGQINYPEEAKISFENASHMITELSLEEGKLWATIETLPTPQGKILDNLLETTEITLRPYGTTENSKVDENGILVIGDDYKLISISAVRKSEAS